MGDGKTVLSPISGRDYESRSLSSAQLPSRSLFIHVVHRRYQLRRQGYGRSLNRGNVSCHSKLYRMRLQRLHARIMETHSILLLWHSNGRRTAHLSPRSHLPTNPPASVYRRLFDQDVGPVPYPRGGSTRKHHKRDGLRGTERRR